MKIVTGSKIAYLCDFTEAGAFGYPPGLVGGDGKEEAGATKKRPTGDI